MQVRDFDVNGADEQVELPPVPSDRGSSPIAGYGFLSDCSSSALVDTACSIHWWCAPRFHSPSIVARLLDPRPGHWSIAAGETFTSEREHVGDSLVLRTVLRTDSGAVAVIRCAEPATGRTRPRHRAAAAHAAAPRGGARGRGDDAAGIGTTPGVGAHGPALAADDDAAWALRAGAVGFRLVGDVGLDADGGTLRGTFRVRAGPRMLATIEAVRDRLGDGSLVRRRAIGASTVGTILGSRLVNGLLDHYLGRTGYSCQQTSEKHDPETPHYLFNPVPGDYGTHGPFDDVAHPRSLQLPLSLHRANLLAGLGAVAAATASVALAARRG